MTDTNSSDQGAVMEAAYCCTQEIKQVVLRSGLKIDAKALRAIYGLLLNELETKDGIKPCRHGRCKTIDADRLR